MKKPMATRIKMVVLAVMCSKRRKIARLQEARSGVARNFRACSILGLV